MSLSTPLDKADANRDLASSMEDDGEKTPVSVGWRGLGVGGNIYTHDNIETSGGEVYVHTCFYGRVGRRAGGGRVMYKYMLICRQDGAELNIYVILYGEWGVKEGE